MVCFAIYNICVPALIFNPNSLFFTVIHRYPILFSLRHGRGSGTQEMT